MLAHSNTQFVLTVIVVIFTAIIFIAPANIRSTQSTYYWLEYEKSSVNPEGNQSWIFTGRTDAEAETPILWPSDAKNWHWKRPWCWERLKAGGEKDDRGSDGWMASLTQWTWVWASSRNWSWTGKPGVLKSMGSQRIRHNLLTKQLLSSFSRW